MVHHLEGVLPFRKTAPSRVALTTYFGKTFVTRSDKKVYDYGAWLKDQVTAKAMDRTSNDITDLVPANVFDSTFDSPRSYSSLSMGFKSFKCKGYTFNFDRNSNVFDPEIVKNYTNNKMVVVAKNDQGKHLVLDKNNALYVVNGEVLEPAGNMESFLGIDPFNAPVDFAQVKIYGKTIPVGVVLGYLYGMDNLIKMLKVQPRRVPAGQRQNLQSHEFAIQFSDETLIFSKYDDLAAMVFGGFKEYEKATKLYASHTFDKPNVYLNILESQGIGVRYIKEIDLFDKLFVDPISKGILEQKGHPTSFSELLVKACESLLTDAHPDQSDMQFMRIRGYERIAGAVYSEICQSVREHSKKSTRAHQKMEMHPQAIWLKIAQDPSVTIVSEINPIKNLKEREAVTYNGVGGRTSRSMTRSTRVYHKNDMGIISESTVDSSDVAINTYMSADPIFDSLRGTARIFDIEKDGPASLMSTSGILSVASDHDD